MKKIELICKNPIVTFSIVIFDILSMLLFIYGIIKKDIIMEFLNFLWSNIEIITVLIAVIITTIFIIYTKVKSRRLILINDLKSLNIRLKLIQARLNSVNDIRDFRREEIYPSEIKRLLTDDEILELKKHDYSDDTIKRILNAVVVETINK